MLTTKNPILNRVQVCVIGAGVVGLATARALALSGKEVLILERESVHGSGTSSRNSEVIHAGIYYKPNSYKAKLCLAGRELLYDYCKERHIPHSQVGKLIVATNDQQMKADIPKIISQANQNNVTNLKLLTKHDVEFLEPNVSSHGGIFSPSTGIIDSHSLLLSFLADAENSSSTTSSGSATLAVCSNAVKVTLSPYCKSIFVETDDMKLECDMVVNCAGLYSHLLLQSMIQSIQEWSPKMNDEQHIHHNNHNDPQSSRIRNNNHHSIFNIPRTQYFAKGNYFRLSKTKKAPFNHLVYPVPEIGGLGVHATIDLGGSIRFGPDVQWLSPGDNNPDDFNMDVDESRSLAFYSAIRKYWPALQNDTLVPDYAGIRPKLFHVNRYYLQNDSNRSKTEDLTDFAIHGPKHHGIKGYVNLMGIESPGLTCSMAIANTVVDLLR